jgi:hypothetical protein
MDISDRIVFNGPGGVPSIFFPAGRPEDGGSCSFAIEECLVDCPSALATNEHEVRALDFFKTQPADTIVEKILQDLETDVYEYYYNILYWFPWGDCLAELTDKCCEIMTALNDKMIVQYGFTTNRELWENLPLSNRLRMGLSLYTEQSPENFKKALELSKDRLVCYPDMKQWQGRFYFDGRLVATCTDWWCTWEDGQTYNSDCLRCIWCHKGCFADKNDL